MELYFRESINFKKEKQEQYKKIVRLLKNCGEIINLSNEDNEVFFRDVHTLLKADFLIIDLMCDDDVKGFELAFTENLLRDPLLLYDKKAFTPSGKTLKYVEDSHFDLRGYDDFNKIDKIIEEYL